MSVLFKFSERLFLRYVVIFTAVVCWALISIVAVETWFSYQDSKAALSRIELEQVDAAAGRISEFVKEIEAQLSWTTHQAWTSADRDRLELWRLLLRQVPAITELQLLDSTG